MRSRKVGSWVDFRDAGNHLSFLKGPTTLVEERREEQRMEGGGRPSGSERRGEGWAQPLPAGRLPPQASLQSVPEQPRDSPNDGLTGEGEGRPPDPSSQWPTRGCGAAGVTEATPRGRDPRKEA